MPAAFLDANVFFAAVKSRTGGSYFIIELAKKNLLDLVTTEYALAEAEWNIKKKLGDLALKKHYENLLEAKPRIQTITGLPEPIEDKLKPLIAEKDIPIVVGAFLSGAGALITLDKKHLLNNQQLLGLNLPFSIMTPGDFIKVYIGV